MFPIAISLPMRNVRSQVNYNTTQTCYEGHIKLLPGTHADINYYHVTIASCCTNRQPMAIRKL